MAPSYSSIEGFIAAKVLVEGLRRAGKQPTREKPDRGARVHESTTTWAGWR